MYVIETLTFRHKLLINPFRAVVLKQILNLFLPILPIRLKSDLLVRSACLNKYLFETYFLKAIALPNFLQSVSRI